MKHKKKAPVILKGQFTKTTGKAQIYYYAYCCDRRAKYCLNCELKYRSTKDFEEAAKWREKKRDLLDLRDELLDFIEPDYIFRERVRIAPEDSSEEYPPIFSDVSFLCYQSGAFFLFRKDFDSTYEDELPSVSEDRFSCKGPDILPIVSQKRCERVLERLWRGGDN